MADSLELFLTLMRAFCEHIPRATFEDIRRLVVLAWAVVGVCLTQTVNFNLWSEVIIGPAQYASSHQRRFQRWMHHKRVKPAKFFYPLIGPPWKSGLQSR